MNHRRIHRLRSSMLAGTAALAIVLPIALFSGATAAYAAVPCVVGPGVTQTDTTVTGSPGNDTRQRLGEARKVCTNQGGLFTVLPLALGYTCLGTRSR